ncbi:MAG: metal-dependent transcriptional regulator, partial [Bacteroidota bacterium]
MGGPTTTSTEEDYLKVIYQLSEHARSQVSTSSVAQHIKTSAASVTDMLKKLSVKGFIHYEPYKGARLSPAGQRLATILVRKHRLWETFLVQKLDFTWDEVHEVAEQLEHIDSDKLVDRLDHFLGYPKYDPHGDPIPNAEGKFTLRDQTILSKVPTGA